MSAEGPLIPPGSAYVPAVASASRSLTMPIAIAGAVGLGALVFFALQSERERRPAQAPGIEQIPPTFSADLPPPPAAEGPIRGTPPVAEMYPDLGATPTAHDGGAGASAAPSGPEVPGAPSLVVDLTTPAAPLPEPGALPARDGMRGAAAGALAATLPGAPAQAATADDRFSAELRGATDARAYALAAPGATIVEGTMIAAVLETAISSDVPGLARAVISRDVRSFDGSRVLVPVGSRVIGQYKSGVALGQSRAFVIWNRLVRPDGASIQLASPGTDAFGRGGLEGQVDRHYLRRFGGSVLLSLVSAGASRQGDTNVIIAGARGGADAAAIALQREIDQPPTIRIPQGAPIRIFVARDLDFSAVEAVR